MIWPGNYRVELRRPERRFGSDVYILGDNSPFESGLFLWRPGEKEDPRENWVEVLPNVDINDGPSFHLDDEMAKVLRDALNAAIPPTPVDPLREEIIALALTDARETRDRLLAIVEKMRR